MKRKNYLILMMLTLVSACSSVPETAQLPILGIDGKACVGDVITPPPGLIEVQDEPLLKSALGESGKGMLCAGKVFTVEKPVVVYRVWDASKSYTAYGRWWSLASPKGPREQYQKANDICPSWSALDRMSQCTLKAGAHIVIGPGQSALCEDGLYPASAVNQVFVPNGGKDGQVLVENCTPGIAWP